MSIIKTDVLIAGGGPAGAAAAISLLNNGSVDVTIIEQSALDNNRVGEHVSAAIFDLLKYLKIETDAFGEDCFLPNYGNTSYWGIDQPMLRDSILTTERSSHQLDRENFDLTLLKRVSDLGGRVIPRTKCVACNQLDDGSWEINARHLTNDDFTIHARYLVDATGRQASICRQLAIPSTKQDQLVAVGTYLHFNGQTMPQEVTIETTELGWWYCARLKDNRISTMFFSDADIVSKHEINKSEKWAQLLASTRHIKEKIRGGQSVDTSPWVRNAYSQITDNSKSKNFIAIGDAAAAFDPVSSMGIGFAITSACTGAAIILAELTQHEPSRIATYQSDLERNFGNYLVMRKNIYQQEKRWPQSEFWARRQ